MGKENYLQESRAGTPLYLAPEIIKLKPYDYKVDIWGLGCVLHHLVCLEPPFYGENLIMLGYNILHKQPKKPPFIYSEKLSNFIFSLLNKNVLGRPNIKQVTDKIKENFNAFGFIIFYYNVLTHLF